MTTSLPHNTAHEQSSDEYTPKKEDKFSFGLWTVGNGVVRSGLALVSIGTMSSLL